MNFGILTLATLGDFKKAIGLALSVRVSNPGVPIAVACSPKVRSLVAPHFDHVVDENPTLRGFEHKLHLDRYSPFEETFFFDADVLVFRRLDEVIDGWRNRPYAACGDYVSGGRSAFGLDRTSVLKLIGKDRLVRIDGAGHAYFRKPECLRVFDLARTVAADYRAYAGDIRLADEDVVDIAMTILGLEPLSCKEFWSRYCSGRRGSIEMNAAAGHCSFVAVTTGSVQRPHMMHFAANEAPFVYASQLARLYKRFDVDTKGLFWLAVSDYFESQIKWPAKQVIKRLLLKGQDRGLLRSSLPLRA